MAAVRNLPRSLRRIALGAGLIGLVGLAHGFGWLGLGAAADPPRTLIWNGVDPRDVRPLAFLAAADVELASLPERAPATVLGDPEYVLWVNGQRAGSGRYRAGAAPDRFELRPLLVEGRNRVVLELRSVVGSGAASFRLEDGAGRILLDSGADWRLYGAAWRGLLEGRELIPAPHVSVVGTEPFGRWGALGEGRDRPRFDEVLAARRPRRAKWFRRPLESGRWIRLPRSDRNRPGLGQLVEFDFGREVVGYLAVSVRGEDSVAGLVRFGSEPSQRSGWLPDAIPVTLPHRRHWQDVEPRRFRYVEVAGLDGILSASVLEVRPASLESLAAAGRPSGLFGIDPPLLRYPVQETIWKRTRFLRRIPPDPTPRSGPAGVRRGASGRNPEPARAPVARPSPGSDRVPAAPARRAPRRARRPRPESPPEARSPGSAPAARG